MYVIFALLAIISVFVLRTVFVLWSRKSEKFSKENARTLIVLGSGGHTSEMTRHLLKLNPRLYQPRLYVSAESDSSSKYKIKSVEAQFRSISLTEFSTKDIPRSRKVKQSYISSIFTTLYSTFACIPIVYSFKPDLILCNGPGTCIPICVVAFLMKVLFLLKTKIVFVESICRVQTLSLSGKILLRFADKVLVQWPDLQKNYPGSEYIGRLI